MNFPSNPNLNDVYSFGNKCWKWNGRVWQPIAKGITADDIPGLDAAKIATGKFDINRLPAIEYTYLSNRPTTLAGYGITDAQPSSAKLTSLDGLGTGNGIVIQNGANSFIKRILAVGTGMSISNPDGSGGNPTITLKNTLINFSNLSGAGVVTATATDTFAMRSIGVAGANDIIDRNAGDGRYLQRTGGTLTGYLNLHADPVDALQPATKQYVDALVQGLDPKGSVLAASVANVSLTAPGAALDGVTLTLNARILLKNQTAPAQNGIYVWKGAAVALVRDAAMDIWDEVPGAFVFIEQGTNADTGWVCTSKAGGTMGTTAITWVQFSGAGTYGAGAGLTLSGTNFELTGQALALHNYNTNGFVVRTGVGAFTPRTISAPNPGINIANGDGISGNPTLSLADDLAAVENLNTTGIVRRTATNTWSASSLVNADLPASGATAGTYRQVTINDRGVVTTGTNPTTLSGYGITDAVSMTTTNLGKTGATAVNNTTITDPASWATLPIGYSAFVSSNVGITNGAPVNAFGYFTKLAHRDTGGGWAGLWVGRGQVPDASFIGTSETSTSYATWRKLWTDANMGAGSGLDADMVDGIQGTDLARKVVTTARGGTTAENGSNTWAKLATYSTTGNSTTGVFSYALTSSTSGTNLSVNFTVMVRAAGSAGGNPTLRINISSVTGPTDTVVFKLIANTPATGHELWIKKPSQYYTFGLTELASTTDWGFGSVVYSIAPSWQSAEPIGDLVNVYSQEPSYNAANVNTGILPAAQLPAFTGDVTSPAGSAIQTLTNVNSNVGSFGSATQVATFTVDTKGRTTAAGNVTITPAWGSISGTPTTLSGYGITDAASTTALNDAIALQGAAMWPERYDSTGISYFVTQPQSTQGGNPNTIPLAQSTDTVTGFGPVRRVTISGSGALADFGHRMVLTPTTGRIYRVEVELQRISVTNDTGRVWIGLRNLNDSYASTSSTNGPSIILNGDVQTHSVLFADAATASGKSGVRPWTSAAVWLRPYARAETTSSGSIVVDFRRLKVTDVTDIYMATPAWSSITGKPTTLSGYGITDAQTASTTLNNLSALDNVAGIVTQIGSNTFTKRTINTGTVGISIANGSGAGGNPVISLSSGMVSLENLTGAGVVTTTATNVFAMRSIGAAAANDIIDRQTGDARYALSSAASVTTFNTRTGAVTLSNADVVGALGYTPINPNNTGAGSSLDADLLDGQHGSYYRDWGNVTNRPNSLSGYGITDAVALTTGSVHTGMHTLAAGTTTLAPLRFQAGALLNTTLAHAVEWNGANLYVTNSSAVRKTIAYTDSSISGSAGTLATGRTIGMTGDVVWTSGAFNGGGNVTGTSTLATVNSNTGSFGSATQVATFTVDAKGRTTAAGNVTVTPAWGSISGKPTTLSGYGITDAAATSHKYHLLTNGEYLFDDYSQNRFLRLFIENTTSDIFRFCPISEVEYWDFTSSEWVSWPEGAASITNLLDGRDGSGWNIPHAYRKFRFVIQKSNGYPSTSILVLQSGRTAIQYTSTTVTLENRVSNVWTVKETAIFNGTTTANGWGLHTKVISSMHDGINNTRVTIDIDDWVDASGYNAAPMRRLMLLSNYANVAREPWSWNYNRVVTFNVRPIFGSNLAWDAGNFNPTTKLDTSAYTASDVLTKIKTVHGLGSGLDADLLDGQQGSYYQNASNLNNGLLPAARLPAFTGDVTSPAGSAAQTLATVNSNVGSFGSATQVATFTVDAKGRTTAAGNVTITPAWGSISGKPTTLSGYGITDGQSALGFVPVQQGTGTGQLAGNIVKIGWGSSRLKVTVDTTDLGNVVFDANLNAGLNTKANSANPEFTGTKFTTSTSINEYPGTGTTIGFNTYYGTTWTYRTASQAAWYIRHSGQTFDFGYGPGGAAGSTYTPVTALSINGSNSTVLIYGNTAWHAGNFDPTTKVNWTDISVNADESQIVRRKSDAGINAGGMSTFSDVNLSGMLVRGIDPYIRQTVNNRQVVFSGGMGWTDTGSVLVVYGKDHATQAGNVLLETTGTLPNSTFTASNFKNISLSARPTFAGALAWDAANLTPADLNLPNTFKEAATFQKGVNITAGGFTYMGNGFSQTTANNSFVQRDGAGWVYGQGFRVESGDGVGLRLWNGNSDYSVYMSSAGNSTHGGRIWETASDFNMYFKMAGGTNRGFNFKSGNAVVAGIDAGGTLRVAGSIETAGDVYCSNWFRTRGNNAGLYWEQFGGGWNMTDSTWVRSYNNKNILTGGDIQANDYIVTSDRRLKKNIAPLLGSRELIQATEPKSYIKNGRPMVGMIAQDVQKIAPDMVREGGEYLDDGVTPALTLDILQYIPHLLAEVKSLRQELEQLKSGLA